MSTDVEIKEVLAVSDVAQFRAVSVFFSFASVMYMNDQIRNAQCMPPSLCANHSVFVTRIRCSTWYNRHVLRQQAITRYGSSYLAVALETPSSCSFLYHPMRPTALSGVQRSSMQVNRRLSVRNPSTLDADAPDSQSSYSGEVLSDRKRFHRRQVRERCPSLFPTSLRRSFGGCCRRLAGLYLQDLQHRYRAKSKLTGSQPQYGTAPVMPLMVLEIVEPMSAAPSLDRWPLSCHIVSQESTKYRHPELLTSNPTALCSMTSQST